MKGNWKHGMYDHKIYRMWASMIGRCKWPSHTSWKWYGARGVSVCEEWKDFTKFLTDMGPPPFPNASIERIDKNGPYSKNNCCWADPKTQARNKRSNRLISFLGMTKCISAWSEYLGWPPGILYDRLRRGWSIDRALTEIPKTMRSP